MHRPRHCARCATIGSTRTARRSKAEVLHQSVHARGEVKHHARACERKVGRLLLATWNSPARRRPCIVERMAITPLQTYLNDHVAGSRTALELLDFLIDAHADGEARAFFTTLRKVPALAGLDLAALQARAEDQFARVEARRVSTAAAVLAA